MLFKDRFKPKQYQKLYAVGYYTPTNGFTTIQTRVGKQSAISSVKIPTKIFDLLDVDENDNSITNLSEFPELVIVKDDESGFKKLEYHAKKSSASGANTDDGED